MSSSSSSSSILPFTHNALQIDFEQVLNLDDHGLVSVFNSLIQSGLKGFLGCSPLYHQEALTDFFNTASITPTGDISCTVRGKQITVEKPLFISTFNLPTSGLVNVLDAPLTSVKEMQKKFSLEKRPIQFTDKRSELKVEFRVLHDIVAKSLLAKAGPCDVLTQEKFLFMVAIFTGEKINWGTILFDVLKYLVSQPSRKVKGFTVQISLVLAKYTDDMGPPTLLSVRKVLCKKNNPLDAPQIEKGVALGKKAELVAQKLKKVAEASRKRKGAGEEEGSAQKKRKKMIFRKVLRPKQIEDSMTARVSALIQQGMSLESSKKGAAEEVDDDRAAAEQSQRAPTFTQAAPQLTLQLLHRQMDELKTEQHSLASDLKTFKESALQKISDLHYHFQRSIVLLTDRVRDSERNISEQIAVLGQQVAELVRLKQASVDKSGESSHTHPKKHYEPHPRQPLMQTVTGQGKGGMKRGGRMSSDPSIADATDQFIEELDRMDVESEQPEQIETRGRTFTLEQLIKLTGSFTAEQIGEFFKVLEHNPSMIFFLRKLYSQ